MTLNIDIDNLTLDILSARLKNVVSPLDILKWLSNFPKNEAEMAIDFLSNMTVYSTFEIEEILNQNFSVIIKTLEKNEKLVIHPVGKFGKSGSMIAYFFQKTNFYKTFKNRISLLASLENFIPIADTKYSLALLDDFVGSGKTINDYYNEKIEGKSDLFQKIIFTGIAGMEDGIKNIKPNFSNVVIPESNVFLKTFSSKVSYFGYRKYLKHRELAFKYGKLLTNPIKLKNGNDKFIHALGYNNSQALVSFSYGSPNNTLPIIYSSGNKTTKWIPLIPRFSNDKINSARDFRKMVSHELSILKEFGSEIVRDNFFTLKVKKGNKIFSSVNHIDFSIYSIIKLSRDGYTPISICHKLGILYSDYENYLKLGKERGIFRDFDKLTIFGLELFADAKKCINKRKKSIIYDNSDSYSIREIEYIPKSFNGRS